MQQFQVEKSDKTTKICENCWCEIRHSIEFLDICAAANETQTTGSVSSTDAIDEFIERQDVSTNYKTSRSSYNRSSVGIQPIICISLINDEMDSENDEAYTDQKNASETRTTTVEVTSSSITAKRAKNKSAKNKSAKNKRAKNKKAKKKTDKKILFKCWASGRCRELFESRDEWQMHLENYHANVNKRTFDCYLCAKSFRLKQRLQNHMNSLHTRQICFKCPIRTCLRIFTEKGHLKRHTNSVHTKKVAFKCWRCPNKFYRKDSLRNHLAIVHCEKIRFTCYMCKVSLSSKKYLQSHMKSFHIRKVFNCPFPKCSKSFMRNDRLKQHINAIHTKKIVFKCPECDKKFYSREQRNSHLKRPNSALHFGILNDSKRIHFEKNVTSSCC